MEKKNNKKSTDAKKSAPVAKKAEVKKAPAKAVPAAKKAEVKKAPAKAAPAAKKAEVKKAPAKAAPAAKKAEVKKAPVLAPGEKMRIMVSYDKMDDKLREAFNVAFPKGYDDYALLLTPIETKNGTVFVVSVETDDTIALVKIPVSVDDEVTAKSFFETLESDESGDSQSEEGSGEGFPDDDNINQYANTEDDPADSE